MIRVEFLALRSEIQDKLDKGWPVSRIWAAPVEILVNASG